MLSEKNKKKVMQLLFYLMTPFIFLPVTIILVLLGIAVETITSALFPSLHPGQGIQFFLVIWCVINLANPKNLSKKLEMIAEYKKAYFEFRDTFVEMNS